MKRIPIYKNWLLAAVCSVLFVGAASAMSPPVHAEPLAASKPTTIAAACPSLANLHKGSSQGGGEKCFVNKYINPTIKLLGGAVALFVVISFIVGGIQYSSSADDPSKVSAAKNRIRDGFIALLAFLFMLAFLNWIVPGGVAG